MGIKRSIESLNLIEDFLFHEVLNDQEFGKQAAQLILSIIMERSVGEVAVHPQKTLTPGTTGGHGIRMDVYIEEEGSESAGGIGSVYDLEPQQGRIKELPRRGRYYQALIDSKMLGTGDSYRKLKQLWIIVITSEDPFGHDQMCYTFENRCSENTDITLDDGAWRIYLYSRGKIGARGDLAALLRYFENSQPENAVTQKLRQIHEIVENVKHRHEVGVRYMKAIEYEYYIRETAQEEGRAQGRAQGQAEGKQQHLLHQICKKLIKGKSAEVIAEELEEDLNEIIPIYTIVKGYAPDYDMNKIYEELQK